MKLLQRLKMKRRMH